MPATRWAPPYYHDQVAVIISFLMVLFRQSSQDGSVSCLLFTVVLLSDVRVIKPVAEHIVSVKCAMCRITGNGGGGDHVLSYMRNTDHGQRHVLPKLWLQFVSGVTGFDGQAGRIRRTRRCRRAEEAPDHG